VSDLESAYIPYLNGQYTQPAPDDGKPHLWAQKGFKFHDLLDAINPLQHLPVISSIYRWITGDTIGNIPRIVGDAIYGGIPGFVSGLFNVLLKEETGEDVGEHVVATLFGDSKSTPTIPAQNANQPELTTEQAAQLTHTPIEASALTPLSAVATAPTTPAPAATTATTSATAAPPPVATTAAPTNPRRRSRRDRARAARSSADPARARPGHERRSVDPAARDHGLEGCRRHGVPHAGRPAAAAAPRQRSAAA